MKKVIYLTALVAALGSITACSNQGAYTQHEKDSMDNVDTAGRSDRFEALEKMGDSSAQVQKEENKPADSKNAPASSVPVPPPHGQPTPIKSGKQ